MLLLNAGEPTITAGLNSSKSERSHEIDRVEVGAPVDAHGAGDAEVHAEILIEHITLTAGPLLPVEKPSAVGRTPPSAKLKRPPGNFRLAFCAATLVGVKVKLSEHLPGGGAPGWWRCW